MYKVIDNFLPDSYFSEIKEVIFSPKFSWNLSNGVTGVIGQETKTTSSYYFTHLFFSEFYMDETCKMFSSLLTKLSCRSLIRIKANLYPSTDNVEYHCHHLDESYSHGGAILYLNTNNGYTILSQESTEEIFIESIENRLLLFDPSKLHRSTTCTDVPYRANINFNYF